MKIYVLDACALIATALDEPGAHHVEKTMYAASRKRASIHMHRVNLLEAYYDSWRSAGSRAAGAFLQFALNLPVRFESKIDDDLFRRAGRLKGTHRLSLADALAALLALGLGAGAGHLRSAGFRAA